MDNYEAIIRMNMQKYQGKLPHGVIPIPPKTTIDPKIALDLARVEIAQMDKAIRAGPRDLKSSI